MDEYSSTVEMDIKVDYRKLHMDYRPIQESYKRMWPVLYYERELDKCQNGRTFLYISDV